MFILTTSNLFFLTHLVSIRQIEQLARATLLSVTVIHACAKFKFPF